MNTKTLLIAAAALAVGVISSQAQVYSQNVVGYVNQTIAPGAYQIVGNQMVNGSDVNQTNGNVNTVLLNGFVSSPNDPPSTSSNSVLYVWNGVSYASYYFFTAADANTWNGTPVAGWYDLLGNMANFNLSANKAAFIQNHSASAMTVTTVGNVLQGTNAIYTITAGYNLICLAEPISTNPIVAGYGLPANMTSAPNDPPTINSNDAIFVWNGVSYATYYYFTAADANTWNGTPVAGFYDLLGNLMPASSYPQVNQGFFLYHTGAPLLWTNTFNIQ